MIRITRGREGSDCTAPYIIQFLEGMIVGDFIKEWLENKTEWGYFGIYDGKTVCGSPRCEYWKGEIKGELLPDEYLNKSIKEVFGSGGWSRSDFVFVV